MDVISGKRNLQGMVDKTAWEGCVLCGRYIGIKKDTPIGERKYYVETAGQLCEDCYAKVYGKEHNDNILDL